MSLRHYRHPHALFNQLQNELMPFIWCEPEKTAHSQAAWVPKVDIKEEEKEFVVYADIPGVDPNEIEIEMDGNILTVKGERKSEQEEKGKQYYRLERKTGKFYRQFTLPESVDSSKISAKTKNGVLAIHLPKAQESKHARKITIEQENA
ncbi:Hsp20 family protein [Candidatus Berkiella aquae]|uniref:Hsp20/alpha crystallin family protein n=1 Tax=Candidatus Berkiella aquae TaxID=295108 RepID=A0A0Q9YXQ8_9GAMM|nr:Hsp20/alpha crystallin family protein [Candidatus Berkiella aquae]MCS5710565.1 Hsp20/alpha crystallin family protein [Candidatus Berkiella aquae]